MGKFQWQPKKKILTLKLPKDAQPLFGEVAEARLMSLANAMSAELIVKMAK